MYKGRRKSPLFFVPGFVESARRLVYIERSASQPLPPRVSPTITHETDSSPTDDHFAGAVGCEWHEPGSSRAAMGCDQEGAHEDSAGRAGLDASAVVVLFKRRGFCGRKGAQPGRVVPGEAGLRVSSLSAPAFRNRIRVLDVARVARPARSELR